MKHLREFPQVYI